MLFNKNRRNKFIEKDYNFPTVSLFYIRVLAVTDDILLLFTSNFTNKYPKAIGRKRFCFKDTFAKGDRALKSFI